MVDPPHLWLVLHIAGLWKSQGSIRLFLCCLQSPVLSITPSQHVMLSGAPCFPAVPCIFAVEASHTGLHPVLHSWTRWTGAWGAGEGVVWLAHGHQAARSCMHPSGRQVPAPLQGRDLAGMGQSGWWGLKSGGLYGCAPPHTRAQRRGGWDRSHIPKPPIISSAQDVCIAWDHSHFGSCASKLQINIYIF